MLAVRGARIAMIFQEPMTSLNPVLTINRQVTEMLELHLAYNPTKARERAIEMLDLVGIPDARKRIDDYPYQFSGGMRQRVMIAMAPSCNPMMLIADEPTTALDVSMQAQIINLLEEIQETRKDLTYLFIAHDLSVVRHISDRVAVMYLGRIVEITRARTLYRNPLHPYTKALLSAVPIADPFVEESREKFVLPGEVPSPLNPPLGCSFHPRCSMASTECSQVVSPLIDREEEHMVACIKV